MKGWRRAGLPLWLLVARSSAEAFVSNDGELQVVVQIVPVNTGGMLENYRQVLFASPGRVTTEEDGERVKRAFFPPDTYPQFVEHQGSLRFLLPLVEVPHGWLPVLEERDVEQG